MIGIHSFIERSISNSIINNFLKFKLLSHKYFNIVFYFLLSSSTLKARFYILFGLILNYPSSPTMKDVLFAFDFNLSIVIMMNQQQTSFVQSHLRHSFTISRRFDFFILQTAFWLRNETLSNSSILKTK